MAVIHPDASGERRSPEDTLDRVMSVVHAVLPSIYYFSFFVVTYTVAAFLLFLGTVWWVSINALRLPLAHNPYLMVGVYLLSFAVSMAALIGLWLIWRWHRHMRRQFIYIGVILEEPDAYMDIIKDFRLSLQHSE